LVTVRNELEEAQTHLTKAKKVNELVSLDSPDDAVVLKIGKFSAGSVATAGGELNEPLFTLVPLASPLEAEVRVHSADIGFVQVGDPVEMKFDAYQFYQHGTAKGIIKTISEGTFAGEDDATVEPSIQADNRETFFKLRIAFTDVRLRNVPANFRLIPGMSLDADIRVGRRTILSYLLGGVVRTGSEAMREP
jgi:hemolysin D